MRARVAAAVALLALLPAPERGADPWDNYDKAFAATALLALGADWGQTRYVAKHPEQFYEKNRILGEHPSTAKVDRYFVGLAVVGGVIAHYLPSDYRKVFLVTVTIVEIRAVRGNMGIGVGFAF